MKGGGLVLILIMKDTFLAFSHVGLITFIFC